ncbi:MAG: hypothetical protein LBS19_15680 [Clostridiales bacterium]|nr:hypothetical protein [Clostridiales bacterium]
MITLTRAELKTKLGIGDTVHIAKNNASVDGVITDATLHVKGEGGFVSPVSLDEMESIDIDAKAAEVRMKTLSGFAGRKIGLANKAKFNLFELYKDEFEILKSEVPELDRIFSLKHMRDIPRLSDETHAKLTAVVSRVFNNGMISKPAYNAAMGLFDFAAKDYAPLIARYAPSINDEGFSEHLPLALFYYEMGDDVQCFFWLDQYYINLFSQDLRQPATPPDAEDPLWWFYLRMACSYSAYEHIPGMIDSMSECMKDNPVFALESLAFLFALDGEKNKASILLAGENDTPGNIFSLCRVFCTQLRSYPDNYYHRYERCLIEIVRKDLYAQYASNEEITGFVYEYVPYKSYGNILGFDMLRYFFHENECADRTLRNIKDCICNFKAVDEEELAVVLFKRNADSKGTYVAVNIV